MELLAAIPSVIYGLWGIFVLAPLLRDYVEPFLAKTLGWTGLFGGPMYGLGMLAAGIILAIMIVPVIASITREVMTAVPQNQREAVLALGATRWEMIRMGVLRNARIGIVGGVILGLGRALGETMAVTMVIGNRPEMAKSLFAPGYTMASVIANEFTEATGDMYLSALVEIGLALFIVTLIVNALARLLVWSITGGTARLVPNSVPSVYFAASQSCGVASPIWGATGFAVLAAILVIVAAARHFRLPGHQGSRVRSTSRFSPRHRSRPASWAEAWRTPSWVPA